MRKSDYYVYTRTSYLLVRWLAIIDIDIRYVTALFIACKDNHSNSILQIFCLKKDTTHIIYVFQKSKIFLYLCGLEKQYKNYEV